MQAIQTKYIGPTNTRGSRYKAWCDAGSLTVPADYSLEPEDNHRAVAHALRDRLKWNDRSGRLVSGSLPNGDYAHVFIISEQTL
jgi:hypothetical protein